MRQRVSLSSLSSALLIPPLNLIPLALGGLLARRRAPRLGSGIVAGALVGLLACSLPAVSLALLASLEIVLPRTLPKPTLLPAEERPKAIVILSGDAAYGADGGIVPGSGIGAMTLDRLRAGGILARLTALPLLVSGGQLEPGAVPIAVQMAAALREEFGLTATWTEPASVDTWENADYSARILHAADIHTVYVVTHAWHMRRALLAFSRFGITAIPAPVRFDRTPELSTEHFTPHMASLTQSYFAFHEWIGCVYYALRG